MSAQPERARECVHRLFEQQAARTPDAPAVAMAGESLSYVALNRRANRLAMTLLECGVDTETPVAVFVDRSLDLAVAVLGVLKAGGAYVPLDTEQQSRRQAVILDDCRPAVIVTRSSLKSSLPAHQATVVCVDTDTAHAARSGDDDPNPSVTPEHLAYILYTSGSTGRPKGVAVEHRQLVSYLSSAADCYTLHDSRSYAMIQTLAVDTSVTSLYSPWLTGGCVHILSRECALDPQRLAARWQNDPVDCLKIAPSHLAALLESDCAADLLPRRHLILGGEAPTWEIIEQVHRLRPECAIINEYGPTETTVGVIACRLEHDAIDRRSATPPIGMPIGSTRAYLLDDRLQPVRGDAPGELFIGGPQVARGYFNQPQLTARAFVADPFATTADARLYRTGDLARRLASGDLEFVGRADRQVKIRGFRVEPGEIEAVLSEHGAVRQAVVESYADPAGDTRLVAYVVALSDQPPPAARLLRYLGQRLPAPMVPSTVVYLDALPLLSQGKVDRKALPLPRDRRAASPDRRLPARTPLERSLLEIWQQALAIAPIGVNESFFDLGGDSLLAIQLLVQIRRALGREVSMHTLFESPTVAGLAKALSADHDARPAAQTPIVPVSRDGDLPLSRAQERIWFIHQTNPQTVAYSYGTKLCFEGDLDVAALERSLTEEVRRHEIYRTSFHDTATGPVQRVHPPAPVELPLVDLSHLAEDARRPEADRQANLLLEQPFDLGQAPLVRWTLFRLDASSHLLLHVENHLVHDGWSTDLFLQELMDLYNAFSRGRPSPLTDPPIQYGDFACWERKWLRSAEADRQRDFWKTTLAGCQFELPLPFDRRRPPWQSYRGQRHITTLPDDTWQALCAMARRAGATPFMVMLAAFYALLHRYTGQTDINVGTGVANRRRSEFEGVLGMFINNLVLRLDLAGDPSFQALLGRLREVVLRAFAHQELPFDHVVELAGGQPDTSRNPLYQVMFSFHDTPMPDLSVANTRVSMEPSLNTGTSKFDLGVIVYPAAIRGAEADLPATTGPTWIIWEYSTELFDAATIERLAQHFRTLLDQAVAEPGRPLSALSALTAHERSLLLEKWSHTGADCAGEGRVHELFEAQVARAPQATALEYGGASLSYQQLDGRANALADYLRRLGAGSQATVGLCIDPSPEMAVAMLAILKAGATYVPLDPAFPRRRLDFMLADARIGIVLTRHSLRDRLAEAETRLVCLDDELQVRDMPPAEHVADQPGAEDIAYVIYTSGSTGEPKGVAVAHAAIFSNCRIMADQYRLRPGDRVLQFSRFSFDQSLDQILLPLTCGAAVVVPDDEVLDPQRLTRVLSRHRVTVMNLPPAYWRRWVQSLKDDDQQSGLGDLRLVSVGGDVMPTDGVRLWHELDISRTVELLNAYGPTEATITTTIYRVPRDQPSPVVPIGRPIPGRSVYILDRHRQPVPVGAIGELHVGGPLLAQGYLNLPQLTADKFVPDPFSDQRGARLYRTGDRARFRADGNIEFLGRLDHQVKIRGFRVELGEIEARLIQHPRVAEAAVDVHEATPGDWRLAAYLVAGPAPLPVARELRDFLKQQLPDYMVPAAFVELQALPLTPAGKVDRLALPVPDAGSRAPAGDCAAPRTTTEETIAGVCAELLGMDTLGIDDNFFELGGHSLLAMQLITRIRDLCAVDLPVRAIFDSPTVAGLASEVARLAEVDRRRSRPAELSARGPGRR